MIFFLSQCVYLRYICGPSSVFTRRHKSHNRAEGRRNSCACFLTTLKERIIVHELYPQQSVSRPNACRPIFLQTRGLHQRGPLRGVDEFTVQCTQTCGIITSLRSPFTYLSALCVCERETCIKDGATTCAQPRLQNARLICVGCRRSLPACAIKNSTLQPVW